MSPQCQQSYAPRTSLASLPSVFFRQRLWFITWLRIQARRLKIRTFTRLAREKKLHELFRQDHEQSLHEQAQKDRARPTLAGWCVHLLGLFRGVSSGEIYREDNSAKSGVGAPAYLFGVGLYKAWILTRRVTGASSCDGGARFTVSSCLGWIPSGPQDSAGALWSRASCGPPPSPDPTDTCKVVSIFAQL